MADKAAPLPASSGGLMRFFEDETKGFKIDPRIVVSIPISLIAISWIADLFFCSVKKQWKTNQTTFQIFIIDFPLL